MPTIPARVNAAALVTGSALSGVLAYVFFAMATRALGPEQAAPVSVLWTWWSFAAAGLTFPLQHWTVRSVAAHGGEGSVRRDLVRVLLVVSGVSAASGAVTWWAREVLFGTDGLVFPVLVLLVTAGSALTGIVRGLLVARRRVLAVAAALVLENLSRAVLALVLLLRGDAGAALFGLALLAGQVVAVAWPSTWRLGTEGADQDHGAWVSFLGGVSGGQLLAQVVLNGGPVVVAVLGGSPAQVTVLFVTLALFRAPYTLALGAVAPVTGWLSAQVAAGRTGALRRYLGIVCIATALMAVASVPFGYLAGPVLVRAIFGPALVVEGELTALVALGSTVALGVLALSLLAMARGRARTMGAAWVAAVGIAGLVLWLLPAAPVTEVAVAFACAEIVAFLGLLPRPRRTRPQ